MKTISMVAAASVLAGSLVIAKPVRAQNPILNDPKIEECIRILNVNILVVVNGVEAITETRQAVEKAIAEMEGQLNNIKGDLALADEFSSGNFSDYELSYLIAIEQKYSELETQILEFREQLDCWQHIEKVFKLLELKKRNQPSQNVELPEQDKKPGEEDRDRLFDRIVEYWRQRGHEVEQMLTHTQNRKGKAQAEIDKRNSSSDGSFEVSDQPDTGSGATSDTNGASQQDDGDGEFDIGHRLRNHNPFFFSIGVGSVLNDGDYRVPTGGGGGVVAQDFRIDRGNYFLEGRFGSRWAINEQLNFEATIGGYIYNQDSSRIRNIGGPPFGGTVAPFNGTVRTRVVNIGGHFVLLNLFGEGKGDLGLGGTIGWGEQTLKDNNSAFQSTNSINPFSLDLFYRLPVSDNITIEPAVTAIINPNGDGTGSEDTIYVGLIRTIFSF
ncbi:MAG: carbohydrate porin [Pseudomonadota bacterium]